MTNNHGFHCSVESDRKYLPNSAVGKSTPTACCELDLVSLNQVRGYSQNDATILHHSSMNNHYSCGSIGSFVCDRLPYVNIIGRRMRRLNYSSNQVLLAVDRIRSNEIYLVDMDQAIRRAGYQQPSLLLWIGLQSGLLHFKVDLNGG